MSIGAYFASIFGPPEAFKGRPAAPNGTPEDYSRVNYEPLRLAHVTRAPTRDEFDRWRDDPVTQFVMAAVKRNSEEQREEWMRRSWDTGEADQDALIALRERADALEGFAADYEAFCETLNLEPNEGESE